LGPSPGVREAILQAFDLLDLDGVDLRPLPLVDRKTRLARLLKRPPAGLERTPTPTTTAPRSLAKPTALL
jgi:ATP-dependent DNA ligase